MDIGRIFVESHRNAWDLVQRQLPAVLVVVGAELAVALAGRLVEGLATNDIAHGIVSWIGEIVIIWLSAPAMVTIFRHLILGENSDPNPLRRSRASEAYFNAAALLSTLSFAAVLVNLILHHRAASLGVGSGATIAFVFIMLRLATYLPGVAVGRDPKTPALALRETQGRFWSILFTYLLAAIPAAILFLVGIFATVALHARDTWLEAVLVVPPTAAFVLVAFSVSALLYKELRRDPAEAVSAAAVVPARRGPRAAFGRLSYAAAAGDLGGPAARTAEAPASRIRAAYADLFNIVREMWPVLLILSAMYFVCTMAWFFAPSIISTWVGRMVIRMLLFIGIAWFTAPYYVALHRFVATGEARWIPPRDNYDGAGRVYFGWAGMSVALWFMPLIMGDVVDAFSRLGVLVMLVGFIVILCVLARMTTLLPAAALDPQRASWAQAMDDSRGRAWSFFASTTAGALPAIVALVILGQAAAAKTILPIPFFALAVPALLALQLIPLAIGTRLYLNADRGPSIARMDQVIRPR